MDTCDPIPNVDVQCYTDEKSLLEAWLSFLELVDPDVIIGYNSTRFDLPVLVSRMLQAGITEPVLGRIQSK